MSKQAEFAVILKMNPMFADLGADELQRISSLCHTQQLSVGEVLFQKGDAGDALFGVRRGQIRIETGASDGSRLTLNFMGPGELFGEVAVLDGQSRTADAMAGEPSELFVLRRADFLAFLEREPRVAIKIIQLLCQRIRWQSERMEESVLQPLPIRLARRLCALADDFGSEVHISQEQLGIFVGAARESVNRQLQLWRKDGILDLQRGRILLQNMGKLSAVARNGTTRTLFAVTVGCPPVMPSWSRRRANRRRRENPGDRDVTPPRASARCRVALADPCGRRDRKGIRLRHG